MRMRIALSQKYVNAWQPRCRFLSTNRVALTFTAPSLIAPFLPLSLVVTGTQVVGSSRDAIGWVRLVPF